jgi:PAS domain S-box-containing protein
MKPSPVVQDEKTIDSTEVGFELNPLPMWICDARSLRFLAANQEAVAQYGYSRQEFLSLGADSLFAPKSAQHFLKGRETGARFRTATIETAQHITKGGRTFEAEIRTRAVPFRGGDARLIIAEDITTRRETERLLSLRCELMRLFCEAPTDVVNRALGCLCESLDFHAADFWLIETDGGYLRCDASWCRPEMEGRAGGSVLPAGPRGTIGDISVHGELRWIPNMAPEPGYAESDLARQNKGPTAGVAFGVPGNGAVTGVVVLLTRGQNPPGRRLAELLAETGNQLGHCLERRRIADELHKADESFRAFFEDAPIPYHEIDRNGLVTRVNRAECELLGREDSEIIGVPIWDLVAPEERAKSRDSVTRKLRERRTGPPIERRYRARNGEEYVFRVHARLIVDRTGEVTGLRTAMLDLTAVKRLQRRIELQNGLLDQVNDAVLTVDNDFRIQYLNGAAERLFGWSWNEAAGQQYRTVAGTVVTQAEREAIHADILGRGFWSGEIICTRQEGTQYLVDVSWSVLRDSNGNPQGAVGIHRDITAPKQMEQTLRATEHRLQLAQSALALGTWEVDLDSRTVQCSEQLRRLYGLSGSIEQINLDDWHNCIHPDDRERKISDARNHLRDREAFDRQFRVVWPDGSVHWLHSKARVVFDERQQARQVIGVDFDITEHKQTEERLLILSSAVEQSPVSILLTSLGGKIEYANAKLTEASGYTLDELRGRDPRLLLSDETPADEFRAISQALRRGVWRGVLRSRKKNGERSWESVTILSIRDASGKPTHQLAMAEDITERMEIEAAWKLSEERFRVAAESSGDWVYEWEPENDSLRSLGERKRDPVEFGGKLPETGTQLFDLIHAGDRERVRSVVRRSIETGERLTQEFRIVWPTGETRYWTNQGSVLSNADGTPPRWIGVCKDVTAQKKIERAKADLAAVVECADAAIISRDLTDMVTSWNRGAERMYGYPPEEMLGRAFDTLIAAEAVAEYAAAKEKLLRGESITHLEMTHRTRPGKVIHVLLSMSPVYDPDGSTVGTACVAWDVTQIKQLEQQLGQAKKLESIGQLAAGIAHEINTPMQFIGDSVYFLRQSFEDLWRLLESYAELGRAVEDSPEFQALTGKVREIEANTDLPYVQENVPRALERTQEGIEHVSSIVSAMKEFAHPGTNQKSDADINKALRNALTVSRNEYKYVAEVEADFGPLPQVPCHIGELNQVFLNLITNAAHAVGEVVKGTDRRGTIRIRTGVEGDAVCIRIEDTGGGIPAEIRERVFDPFFTTKAVGKGTGQGLAISRSIIVDKHAGSLTFESDPGRGTTFVIRLPVSAPARSAEAGAA